MRTQKATVLPYDAAWKQAFETDREQLQAALGDLALAIEHVGSTSVGRLAAKPILDTDVVIRSYDDFPPWCSVSPPSATAMRETSA